MTLILSLLLSFPSKTFFIFYFHCLSTLWPLFPSSILLFLFSPCPPCGFFSFLLIHLSFFCICSHLLFLSQCLLPSILFLSFLIPPPSSPTLPFYSRKVMRSESARVDRHSSRRRGSSRAKQSRSRSDVDLQPPSTTTTTPVPLTPQHLHP